MEVSPLYEASQFLRELGKLAQKKRKEKGLRYVDLWARTGLQPSSIRAIEQGRYFHFLKIFALLKALGITLELKDDAL